MSLSLFQVNWRDVRHANHHESVARIVAHSGASSDGSLAGILQAHLGAHATIVGVQELFQGLMPEEVKPTEPFPEEKPEASRDVKVVEWAGALEPGTYTCDYVGADGKSQLLKFTVPSVPQPEDNKAVESAAPAQGQEGAE